MTASTVAGEACLLVGAAFFLAGTVGVLRFPDLYSRIHAVAKVDLLGLGFVLLGAALELGELAIAAKLLLVWMLSVHASATIAFLLASTAYARGIRPKTGPAP